MGKLYYCFKRLELSDFEVIGDNFLFHETNKVQEFFDFSNISINFEAIQITDYI